jgi:hypothetical protein
MPTDIRPELLRGFIPAEPANGDVATLCRKRVILWKVGAPGYLVHNLASNRQSGSKKRQMVK